MFRGWVTAALFASRIFGLAAYQTTYVYTAEVYPTTIRSLAMGTGSAFTRIGSMLTPFIAQVTLLLSHGTGMVTPVSNRTPMQVANKSTAVNQSFLQWGGGGWIYCGGK